MGPAAAQICGGYLPRGEQLKHNGGIVHHKRAINKHFGYPVELPDSRPEWDAARRHYVWGEKKIILQTVVGLCCCCRQVRFVGQRVRVTSQDPGPAPGARSMKHKGGERRRCGGRGRVWEPSGAAPEEPAFAQRQTAGVAKSNGRGCEQACVLSAQWNSDLAGPLLSSSQGRFLWKI